MSTAASAAVEQPAAFAFTPENSERAQAIIGKYPAERKASAVIPLLDLAQRQHDNWLPLAAMNAVADMLGMARIRVYEVATFYTMFNKAPVGKHFVQVCTNTPCWLRGSDEVVSACKRKLGVNPGETTADGQFTVVEVECLGACVNAPMAQIGDDFYEDLDGARMEAILDALARGQTPTPGPQNGRQGACPITGPTTLTTVQAAQPAAEAAEGKGDPAASGSKGKSKGGAKSKAAATDAAE